MEQGLIKSKRRLFWILLFISGLISIRAFERDWFYDPFLDFFKDNYQNQDLPKYEGMKLFFGLLLRYFLNSFFSVLIIQTLFRQKSITNLTILLLIIFFLILISVLFGLLLFSKQPDYLVLFYVRRFLIQPLFLMLFVPAFFYQKKEQ